MNAIGSTRQRLKIRRLDLDTGRENVVVISRRSKALRPEVFRGFSRVELRSNSKVLLATLLITDDGLVGADEIGLAEPAFRRFGEPIDGLVAVTPAPPLRQPRCSACQGPGPRLRTAEDRRPSEDDISPVPVTRRTWRSAPSCSPRRVYEHRGTAALSRRWRKPESAWSGTPRWWPTSTASAASRSSHLDDRGADRRRARVPFPRPPRAPSPCPRAPRHHGSARQRRSDVDGMRQLGTLPRLPSHGADACVFRRPTTC